jgi:hypothetical protein
LAEIRTNLDAIAANNPEKFYDSDTIKKNFSYDQRSQAQKDIIDEYIAKANKVAIPDFWASKTNDNIADSYINGTLKSIDLTDLYKNDPTRYQEIQQLIAKKKLYNDANDAITGNTSSLMKAFGLDTEPDIANNGSYYQEQYDKLVNTPEYDAANTAMNTAKQEITKLDDQINNMEKTVRDQYKGTDITSDVLDAVVADRVSALTREKNYATETYNNNLAIKQAIMSDADKKMSYIKMDQDAKRQEFADKMSAFNTMW